MTRSKEAVLPSPSAEFDEMRQIFNRALFLAFSRRKLLMTFSVLALCGLLVVFFRGLAVNAGQWVTMSLTFMPIFLCAGVLLSMGLLLTRVYHHDVKKIPVNYKEIMSQSWEMVIGASYISIPLILTYLLLWVILGVFFLLKEIPMIGDFIGVILAFGPFLLNLGSILLTIANVGILFFVTPALALTTAGHKSVPQIVLRRLKLDVFTNTIHLVIACIPLAVTVAILSFAAVLTGSTYVAVDQTSEIVLQWFFIMLPFTALMSPAVVFFFNFAAESHVVTQKRLRRLHRRAGTFSSAVT